MKINFNKILVFTLILMTSHCLFSQDKTLISPYFQLQFFKDNDGQRVLRTTLTYSKNRMEIPIPGMKITFYSGSETKTKILDAVTDNKGVASVLLNNIQSLISDKEGSWSFYSEFEGNDTIGTGNSEILIKDITMKMDLKIIDSTKYVNISVSKTENGIVIPVGSEIIKIYVPRMFSLLPVGEITLDDNGSGSLEFPSDLPGDIDGNIVIIARIEDHPDFGNIEKMSTVKWGIVPDYSYPSGHRALWTKTAPRWMIYTLTILLTGVWAHYLYTIICLIRIKKDARRIKIRKDPENL